MRINVNASENANVNAKASVNAKTYATATMTQYNFFLNPKSVHLLFVSKS